MDKREKSRLLSFAGAVVTDPSRADRLAEIALSSESDRSLSETYREAVRFVVSEVRSGTGRISGSAITDAQKAAVSAVNWARAGQTSSKNG
jgi:hypothetical protein